MHPLKLAQDVDGFAKGTRCRLVRHLKSQDQVIIAIASPNKNFADENVYLFPTGELLLTIPQSYVQGLGVPKNSSRNISVVKLADKIPPRKRKRREVIALCTLWRRSLADGVEWPLDETPGFAYHRKFLAEYQAKWARKMMNRVQAELSRTASEMGCSPVLLARLEILEHTVNEMLEGFSG